MLRPLHKVVVTFSRDSMSWLLVVILQLQAAAVESRVIRNNKREERVVAAVVSSVVLVLLVRISISHSMFSQQCSGWISSPDKGTRPCPSYFSFI